MSESFNNYVHWYWQRRNELTNLVIERTKGIVVDGPFKGMKILSEYSWGDGDTASKLLGLYESELFGCIEHVIAKNPDLILNVGSAEGYYGIGLAIRTDSQTVLIDTEKRAIDICRENARINNINKVHFINESTIEVLKSYLVNYNTPFILMDCEGFEEDLLDVDKLPELSKTFILVESHDCIRSGLTNKLLDKFKNTHNCHVIKQGSKNPYIDIIDDLCDYDKMILCCEVRPSTMYWIYMEPKN